MKINRLTFCIIIIISIISVVMFSHIDCAYICEWSIQLIDHIIDGELSSYANDLNNIGIGVNYSLFSIVVNAIWLLPLYIINCFTTVDLIVFEFWLKVMMLCVNLLTSQVIYKICRIKKADKQLSICVSALYMLSPFVQIFSIGMGQIECISVLMVVLGIKSFLEEKHIKAAAFAGVALLFKTFAIFVIIPFVLLCFKKTKKSFICTALIIVFYIVDKAVSTLLIPGYLNKSSATNNADFISRVFEIRINSIYVYLSVFIILCAICIYLNLDRKVNDDTWYIFSLLFYLSFFVFVRYSMQWLMLIMMLMILGISFDNRKKNYKLALLLGINTITSLIAVISCGKPVHAIYPGRSVFSLMIGREEESHFISRELSNHFDYYEYAGNAAQTILITLIIIYIFILIFEYKNKDYLISEGLQKEKTKSVLTSLQAIPAILSYLTIGIYYYFG